MTDLEPAIAAYRAELSAQADVATTDLDELEDHFRSTVEELRAAGMTSERAIAETLARLGDVPALAREHVRVRTAFGPRLSRVRAWTAAAVLLPAYFAFVPVAARMFTVGGFGINLVLSGAMLAALIAGAAWARPIMLGAVLSSLASTAIVQATEGSALDIARVAAFAAAALLLIPWRRGELPIAAMKLALLGPVYTAADTLFGAQGWAPGAHLLDRPSGLVAFVAVGIAGVGGILRARWATHGAALAAIALALGARGLWALAGQMQMWHPTPWLLYMLCTVVVGIACATASALLGSDRFGASRVRQIG